MGVTQAVLQQRRNGKSFSGAAVAFYDAPIERVIPFSEKPAQHGGLGSILVGPKLRFRKRPIAKRYRSLKNVNF